MAKIRGKASSLKQEISAVYTAIAQLLRIGKKGSKQETFDSTTLDGGIAKTRAATGYAEPGTVDFDMFYDPALSGHQSYTDLIESDVSSTATTNFRITYADAAATTQTMSCVGFGADVEVVMNDGVKMSGSMEITGTAGWPT